MSNQGGYAFDSGNETDQSDSGRRSSLRGQSPGLNIQITAPEESDGGRQSGGDDSVGPVFPKNKAKTGKPPKKNYRFQPKQFGNNAYSINSANASNNNVIDRQNTDPDSATSLNIQQQQTPPAKGTSLTSTNSLKIALPPGLSVKPSTSYTNYLPLADLLDTVGDRAFTSSNPNSPDMHENERDDTGTRGRASSHTHTNTQTLNGADWVDVEEVADLLDDLASESTKQDSERSKKTEDETCDFVPKSNKLLNLEMLYKYMAVIGHGATSRVVLAQNIIDSKYYALKQMKKSDYLNLRSFKTEYEILSSLNHRNIASFHACYIDKHNYYIATQFCAGGPLLDHIRKMKHFSEKIAISYIETIIGAIDYCHSKNIIHRDLKPGNIIFDKPPMTDGKNQDPAKLMLIDFGVAIEIEDDHTNDEYVGTVVYLPPESCRARKGWELKMGDMWSIGIITYILVCGNAPFIAENYQKTLVKIMTDEVKFPTDIELSEDCKNFVKKLLQKEPKQRYTAIQALTDEWIITQRPNDIDLGRAFKRNMEQYDVAAFQYLCVNATLNYGDMDTVDKEIMQQGLKQLRKTNKGDMSEQIIASYLTENAGMSQNDANERANIVMGMVRLASVGFLKTPSASKSISIASQYRSRSASRKHPSNDMNLSASSIAEFMSIPFNSNYATIDENKAMGINTMEAIDNVINTDSAYNTDTIDNKGIKSRQSVNTMTNMKSATSATSVNSVNSMNSMNNTQLVLDQKAGVSKVSVLSVESIEIVQGGENVSVTPVNPNFVMTNDAPNIDNEEVTPYTIIDKDNKPKADETEQKTSAFSCFCCC